MLKLLFTIVDRGKGETAVKLLRRYGVEEHYILLGSGTAGKDLLGVLGLSNTSKDVLLSFLNDAAQDAKAALARALDIDLPGRGIAFTVALSGVAGAATLAKLNGKQQKTEDKTVSEHDNQTTAREEKTHDLILAIVNQGYTDAVMEAARPAGARGGTILHGRGAGAEAAGKFFGITIAPEKEIVIILANASERNAIMSAIARAAGLGTEGQGLVFSLPAGDVMGVARGMSFGGDRL